jgi:glutamate formiminotransferase
VVLACVINVSEGRRADVVTAIATSAGDHLLDVHSDVDHHRSVITIAGPDVEARAFAVVASAVASLDIRAHSGVHPRLGVADVVPFVPVPMGVPVADARARLADAVSSRDRVAARIGGELGVPCFLYGPERSLPSVRRLAFSSSSPDVGPPEPHPTAGACCVGARPVLVAYNVWLDPSVPLPVARSIAAALRGPAVRTLALPMSGSGAHIGVQVSCNLVDPCVVGPAFVYDAVASRAPVRRAELVGLVPAAVLDAVPEARWAELDLHPSRTIEARLRQAGLDGGSRW